MKINRARVEYILGILSLAKHDKLMEFVAAPLVEELVCIQKTNLDNVLILCEQMGVRYMHLSKNEICGCEGIRYNGWPAIWHIGHTLGIEACGNSDQQQVAYGPWFADAAFGGYDIKENCKLLASEVRALNFKFVCNRR